MAALWITGHIKTIAKIIISIKSFFMLTLWLLERILIVILYNCNIDYFSRQKSTDHLGSVRNLYRITVTPTIYNWWLTCSVLAHTKYLRNTSHKIVCFLSISKWKGALYYFKSGSYRITDTVLMWNKFISQMTLWLSTCAARFTRLFANGVRKCVAL